MESTKSKTMTIHMAKKKDEALHEFIQEKGDWLDGNVCNLLNCRLSALRRSEQPLPSTHVRKLVIGAILLQLCLSRLYSCRDDLRFLLHLVDCRDELCDKLSLDTTVIGNLSCIDSYTRESSANVDLILLR